MEFVSTYLMQLASRAPTLLVYIATMGLAIGYWRRYPKPCLLVFLAMALALLVSISSGFAFTFLTHGAHDFGFEHHLIGSILTAISVTTGILHAGAIGILLAAVFVGREHRPSRWPPEERGDVAPSSRPDTRIQG
jgi:hypothetical protein